MIATKLTILNFHNHTLIIVITLIVIAFIIITIIVILNYLPTISIIIIIIVTIIYSYYYTIWLLNFQVCQASAARSSVAPRCGQWRSARASSFDAIPGRGHASAAVGKLLWLLVVAGAAMEMVN